MKEKFLSIFNSEIPLSEKVSLYEDLCSKYSTQDRFYHTIIHIENMINDLDLAWDHFVHSLKDSYENLQSAYNNLYLSIWFHDSIFDPKSKENEINSADFTASELQKLNYRERDLKTICELILCTIHHRPMVDCDLYKLFLDIDLAILGKEVEEYNLYSKNIRKEYSHVPEEIYREKRKEILESFLQKDQIFFTGYFQSKYEASARRNLNLEIKSLELHS